MMSTRAKHRCHRCFQCWYVPYVPQYMNRKGEVRVPKQIIKSTEEVIRIRCLFFVRMIRMSCIKLWTGIQIGDDKQHSSSDKPIRTNDIKKEFEGTRCFMNRICSPSFPCQLQSRDDLTHGNLVDRKERIGERRSTDIHTSQKKEKENSLGTQQHEFHTVTWQ